MPKCFEGKLHSGRKGSAVVLSSGKVKKAPYRGVVTGNERCFTQLFKGSVLFVNATSKKLLWSIIFTLHQV